MATERPLIVEIIGPAGSGKSTIAHALVERSRDGLLALPPDPRSWSGFPFYARNIIASLPVIAAMGLPVGPEGHLSREPVASVVVLNGWSERLRRLNADRHGFVVLDQGPLYLLAELHRHAPVGLLRQSRWWNSMYAQWSDTLHYIIGLDAKDALLIPRIRERSKHHRIKHMTDEEGQRYLSQWRGSLGYIQAHLTSRSPALRVLSFDTSGRSAEALADLVLEELGTE